jgi:hypothetical protein
MDNIPILGYVSLIAKGEIAMDARRSLLVKSFYETVDSIRRDIHDLKVCIRSQKYDPNQPRVPAGQFGGGRWKSESGGFSDADNGARIQLAARQISRSLENECLALYDRDTFHCKIVGLPGCHRQAAERYAACLARKPIPPLNY